jgi:RsiW-degrading membrane proteinase PrsW (M82 family)
VIAAQSIIHKEVCVQATASPANGDLQERSRHNRSSFWRSILLELLALLIFVGIFNLLLPNMGDTLNDVTLIVLGVILSVVPAAIWLTIFYRADRAEPEPKKLVITVYLAGLLVAAALNQLVLKTIFDVESWMFDFWWSQFFGEILIVGFLSMGAVYLVVRFLVFMQPEFDERMDGIVYAVAAGLGVATVSNFNYVLAHGGVDLDIGSIRMVVNTLGFASFAGVLGYFMGQARFEKTPLYYVPGGLVIAATLTGLYFFLLDRVGGSGMSSSAWRDLILAAVVALASTAAVGWLVQRSNEETRRLSRLSASGDAWESLPVAEAVSVTEAASVVQTTAAQPDEAIAAVAPEAELAEPTVAAAPPEPALAEPVPAASAPAASAAGEPTPAEPAAAEPATVELQAAHGGEAQASAPAKPKRRSKKSEA